jgi:hypothetical protein
MIKTLFLTGARVNEFVHIRVEDLYLDDVDAAYLTVAAFRCAPNSSAAEIIWGERMLNCR